MLQVWNTHQIRPSKNQNCPNGRPLVMYTFPALYSTHSHLLPVDDNQIELCREECIFREEYPCDKDIFEMCTIYMEERGWPIPQNTNDASQLYSNLRNILVADIYGQ